MGFYSKLVNVWEEEGSPREEFDSVQGTTSASVRLRTPWSQRNNVVEDILDNRRKWPDSRLLARPPRAFAISVVPEGCEETLTGEKIVYAHAILTVKYSNSPFTGLVREEVRPNSEFLKLSEQHVYWNGTVPPADPEDPPGPATLGDKVSIAEAPGFYRTGWVLIRTLSEIPVPIDDDYLDFIGTVNKDIFILPVIRWGAAPETLLYSDPSIDIQSKANGGKIAKVVQRLVYRPGTWNKYWRTVDNRYVEMVTDKGGTLAAVKNYPLADWTKTRIFRFGITVEEEDG